MTQPRRLRICFVAHFAHRAISGATGGHIGGVERQANLMTKWLAQRGHAVDVITWDEGQPDTVEYDGVRVLSTCRESDGLPGLRFVHPRWTSLIAAMRAADADVYYQNCAEYVTGQVALWCKANKKKFVYSVASDPDCDKRLPTLNSFRERALYRAGLRRADAVIVQTSKQQRMLQDGFARESVMLPMPCERLVLDEREADSTKPGKDVPRVVWVGRLDPVKRAELAIDVAARCPDIQFDMVGPSASEDYTRQLRERSSGLDNVHWVGPVNFAEVGHLYRRSLALLCTSKFEGFPNTFLEAWSMGCPVVSTVDPDDLIRHQALGAVATDADGLAEALRAMTRDGGLRETLSGNCRRFFRERHEKDTAMARFEDLLVRVADGRTLAAYS